MGFLYVVKVLSRGNRGIGSADVELGGRKRIRNYSKSTRNSTIEDEDASTYTFALVGKSWYQFSL